MSNPPFVRFLNETAAPRDKANYNGYLSFIPGAYRGNPDSTLVHRYLANQDFFWLEMKDNITDTSATKIYNTMDDYIIQYNELY